MLITVWQLIPWGTHRTAQYAPVSLWKDGLIAIPALFG
jgi:hypothetical protein